MVDLVERTQILALLEELEAQKSNLLAHELEMMAHIKEKYAEPDDGTFDDKICLEVMLRNVTIPGKAGYYRGASSGIKSRANGVRL